MVAALVLPPCRPAQGPAGGSTRLTRQRRLLRAPEWSRHLAESSPGDTSPDGNGKEQG